MILGRRISIASAALAASLVLSACGGSSTVSAGSYVKSICQTVGPFERNVQASSSALNLSSISNVTQGKQALQTFLASLVSDTDKAVNQLKAAGTPDVKNGKQISSAITGAFTQLRSAMSQAANSAKQLPTSSPQAFKTAADNLGTNIRTSMSGIGASISGLKSPELETAAKKETACQSLSS